MLVANLKLYETVVEHSGRVTLNIPFDTLDLNATALERYLTVHAFEAGSARLFKLPFDIIPTGQEEDFAMSFVNSDIIREKYAQEIHLANPLVKIQWPGRWGEVSRLVCSCAVILNPEEARFWNDSIAKGEGNLQFGVYALDPKQYPSGAGAIVDPAVVSILKRRFSKVSDQINSRKKPDEVKLQARPVAHDRAFFVLIPNFYETSLTSPLT